MCIDYDTRADRLKAHNVSTELNVIASHIIANLSSVSHCSLELRFSCIAAPR